MAGSSKSTYGFLLDTYETEILKIVGIWSAFPDSAMDFRPNPKSRSVIEQMEHQVQSEGRWMTTMLGIDTGDLFLLAVIGTAGRARARFIIFTKMSNGTATHFPRNLGHSQERQRGRQECLDQKEQRLLGWSSR